MFHRLKFEGQNSEERTDVEPSSSNYKQQVPSLSKYLGTLIANLLVFILEHLHVRIPEKFRECSEESYQFKLVQDSIMRFPVVQNLRFVTKKRDLGSATSGRSL
jgi:hypothetical protein